MTPWGLGVLGGSGTPTLGAGGCERKKSDEKNQITFAFVGSRTLVDHRPKDLEYPVMLKGCRWFLLFLGACAPGLPDLPDREGRAEFVDFKIYELSEAGETGELVLVGQALWAGAISFVQ